MLDYISKQYDKILIYILQHLEIVLLSFVIAVIIAIPIGMLISKKKKLQLPIVSTFNAIYAIPSLVLYTLLIPFTGLGLKSAVIALVLYSQFALIKNVAEGFNGVDSSVIEAGKGMGLSKAQLFFNVELPLALPVILAGMRLAITTIATTSVLATSIGAGGLGVLLFDGLRTNNWNKIIVGTILASLFIIIVNQIFQKLERRALKKATGDV